MRAVSTADLHYSLYGSDPVMDNGLPERLYYIDKVFRESILQYAIDNKIENCIVAGDIFHNKSIIHSLAMSTFIDTIRDYPNITFYLIDGNHDHSKMTGDGVSALKALSKEPNVIVVHDTLQIENIYMVAWNSNMIENINKHKGCDYLISHFGLNEATLSSGISIISDIGMKDLKQYKYILLGHYHKPQTIEKNENQLYYIGSPIQLDRGERNENKRFLDIDFENHTIKSIETTGYKKYIQLNITENETIDEILTEAKKLEKAGHEITLELTGENLDITKIPDDFRKIDKRDIDVTNRGISLDMSEEDRLLSFIKIKNISDDSINNYLNIAKEIIGECTND